MKFSLIPRDEKFFSLLSEHAQGVSAGVVCFAELLKKWPNDQTAGLHQLKDIEHECDMTTHEILDKLNRTFVTPIDREDIYMLAKQLDDIIDNAFQIATRMHLYGIKEVSRELINLVDILKDTVSVVVKCVHSISDLSRPQRTLDYCMEINRLENLGDRASEEAIKNLFMHQKDAIELVKWKDVYDLVEDTIDTCEDVANTIESIVVKYG
jgi:predicted phosphate transport protein (TIGR00153 family)